MTVPAGCWTVDVPPPTARASVGRARPTIHSRHSRNPAIDFASTGQGINDLADLALGSQNVALSGKVYTPAQAQVPASVDFGIVHKDDVVAPRNVPVTNSAPVTALNDVLRGTMGPATSAAFPIAGLLPDLGPGQTSNALQVGLNTGAPGGSSTPPPLGASGATTPTCRTCPSSWST